MLAESDIDQQIGDDWAKIQEKYAIEDEAPAPEPEALAEPALESVAEESAADRRARDESGKFVKTPPVDDPAAPADHVKATPAAAEKETPAPSPEGAVSATAEPQLDINRPPATWKPGVRAEWDKLPPLVRAEITRREADFRAGQAQLLPDAKLGANMRTTIEPYRLMIEAEGGTPERAVADLMRTAAIFRVGTVQQKYQAIAGIAQQFGIDLRAFSPPQGQPATAAAQQPQQLLRDPRVDQILAHQQQQEQRRATEQQQRMESAVNSWMNETTAQGQPKREYVGDVINDMSALIPQIRQTNPTFTDTQVLDAAYDRAIWAHPEIRGLLAKKQQTELEAQRRTENQKRVIDAKRAGSVNVPRRGSIPAPGKPGTLDQTIETTARELGLIA